MKKNLELFWVFGLVLIGAAVRAFSNENTAGTRMFWLWAIFSGAAAVFFLLKFFKDRQSPKNYARLVTSVIAETVSVVILIFSGNLFMWWFVGPEGFMWPIPPLTWSDIDSSFGILTLLAILLIAVRTVLTIKNVRWRR